MKPSHYMHFHSTLIKINTLLDIPDQHRNIVQFHTDASVFVFPLAIILFSPLFVHQVRIVSFTEALIIRNFTPTDRSLIIYYIMNFYTAGVQVYMM